MTGRQALAFIELDLGVCALDYGIAPCTAALGVTGETKCFRTPATCQDTDNYSDSPVTLRFGEPSDYLAASGIDVIAASIRSIDFSPAVLAPGEDLGTRASIRITLKDHPHSDTGPGLDPYHAERVYDPFKQGSFWGKFRARHPFVKGAPLRWRQGFLGQSLEEMETRHFVVEDFDGPTPEGVFTLVAKDPLRLLDGKRANAPAASRGSLQASIDDNDGSAVLAGGEDAIAEYPASGYLNIGGKEIVAYTRAGSALTLTGRGQLNTEAVAHAAGERCQVVKSYVAADVADIIHDLMTGHVPGFDPDWIALDDWKDETESFVGRLYTAHIAEPTSVNQLVTELIEQCGLNIWWDDLAQKVRLQVLRQIDTDAGALDDSLILKKTFRSQEQQDKRVSQVWTFYAQTNPLKGLQDKDNYSQAEITVDLGNEERYGQPAIRKIWSRWIPLGGASTAQRTNDLVLGRYLTPPRRFSFLLFRGAQAMPQLGAGYQVGAWTLQDATGARELVPAQCVSVRPRPDRYEVECEELRFVSLGGGGFGDHAIVISGDAYQSVNLRTIHDSLYPAAVAGDIVTVYVQDGARVGATSTGLPALDIGDWPSDAQSGTRSNGSPVITGLSDTSDFAEGMFVRGTGIPNGAKIASVDSGSQITLDTNATSNGTSTVTVYLIIIVVHLRGRIAGRGGAGGTGGDGTGDKPGLAGGGGGTALYTRYPINLVATDGAPQLWGGGGGGGGSGTRHYDDHKGGGGGGGAGNSPGNGGTGPGNGAEGAAGSQAAGGQGGLAWTHTGQIWLPPSFAHNSYRGGKGGNPGQAGSSGAALDTGAGSGGAAGRSIDGVSYVRLTGSADIRGPQVN